MSVRPTNDEAKSIATIRTAVENGVTLIDTADAYCQGESDFGHNEELIARALDGVDADVLVATKGGHTRIGGAWNLNGSPDYLQQAARASARRLGVDQIGLYQFHRPDPSVAYEDSIGALKTLLDEGLIARAGISNANPDQIRQAHAILGDGLVSVQNQYSPSFRSSEPEIDVCDELGLAFLPWSPLGGMRAARRPRRRLRRLRRSGGEARRQPAAGRAGLGAGPVRERHPDPGRQPSGVGDRLDRGRAPAARRRGPRRLSGP